MHRYGFSWLRRALPMLALALVGALLLTIEEGSADAACAEPPGALASAVNGDASGIVLTWEAPAGCAPDSYAVYRRTISEDGSRLAKIATVDGAALTYTDQNVTAGATYRYRVRSNDQGPRSGWTQIVMTEPEPEPAPSTNSAPTFDDGDSATRSVPENSATGTSVGLAVAATDSDTDDTLTYSLSGTDAASFSINSSTGQLQTKAGVTYDYETRNSYSGTVNVSDGKDAAGDTDTAIDDSIDVAITLTDVADAACAEPPGALASAVNGDASGIVLTWEAPAGCAPDTYAVYRRTISEDGSRLAKIATVDGAALTYTDQNVTAGATYRYRVRSNDQGPRSGWTQIVMTEPEPEPAPSTNSAPTFDDGDSATRSVPENSAAGTNVDLAVAATDSDTDDTLAYSLSGTDAASFSINSSTGQLQTKAGVTYDYETRNSYSVTVNVGDGKDAAGEADTAIDDSIDVAITLTDVAEAACAEPPGGLASAVNDDASGIVLTWEAPAGCAPDSYAVYRRTISEDGSRLAKIATVEGAGLTYTDRNVTAGATYRYRVRSNDQGPRSGWTQIVMTEPEPEPEPAERTNRAVLRDAVTLVSNAGQTASVGIQNVSSAYIYAQGFTPGSSETTLGSVTLDDVSGLSADDAPVVSLYSDSSGSPGTKLATLTTPSTLANGDVTFTVAAGTNVTLAASTPYFIHIANTNTSGTFTINRTSSTAEDATSTTGWTIADDGLISANGGTFGPISGLGARVIKLTITAPPTDTTAPALLTATVDGTSLVLTYNEPLDEGSVPGANSYWVTVANYIGRNASSVAVSGSQVTLTLKDLAVHDDTVTFTYGPPSTNRVRDVAGNDAAALSSQAATNDSPAPLLSNWPSDK